MEIEYEVNVGLQGNRRKGRRKNKRVLRCVTINAQSLRNKMDELRSDDFMDRKYHIISVTESWGNKDIPDAIYELKGYRMYRRDRVGAPEGSTILYVKTGIEQRVCRPLNIPGFDSSA